MIIGLLFPIFSEKAFASDEIEISEISESVTEGVIYQETEAVTDGINSVEYNDKKIGVIAAGICYQYAKEALGDKASYLKLGCVYPLPVDLIRSFADECETVYVIEELDDFIETHCLKNGIKVIGKEAFTLLGEYSQSMIAKAILSEEKEFLTTDIDVPGRPPVLCAGCPLL